MFFSVAKVGRLFTERLYLFHGTYTGKKMDENCITWFQSTVGMFILIIHALRYVSHLFFDMHHITNV